MDCKYEYCSPCEICNSKEILLENCEDEPIEDSDTTLPSQISATTNLIQNNSINTTEVDDSVCPKEIQIDIEVPLSAEKAKPSLLWYRNWTNVGVILCVVYNLTIVFLLAMAAIQFRKS